MSNDNQLMQHTDSISLSPSISLVGW